MSIYTKKGDTGTTVIGGIKESKSSVTSNLVGTIDELHVQIGKCYYTTVSTTESQSTVAKDMLMLIANALINLGSVVHYLKQRDSENVKKYTEQGYFTECVKNMESEIDRLQSQLPKLTSFLVFLPNKEGTMVFHEARTTTRRTERQFSEWSNNILSSYYTIEDEAKKKFDRSLNDRILKNIYEETKTESETALSSIVNIQSFLNRLSDYLYMLARNHEQCDMTRENIYEQASRKVQLGLLNDKDI